MLRAATSGEYTQKALAEMVGIDKTTMVVTVDELESAGLAERRPSPSDRRAHVIAVTKAGERKLAKAEAIKEQVQADVLEALPAAQPQGAAGHARHRRPGPDDRSARVLGRPAPPRAPRLTRSKNPRV